MRKANGKRQIFGPPTSFFVGGSPIWGCSPPRPRGRPKSLAAPSAPVYEMASRFGFWRARIFAIIRSRMAKSKIARRDVLAVLVLVLVTLAIFWPLTRAEFTNYDDPRYVTETVNIQSGVTWKAVVWAFTTGYGSNWHPLTWISHMIDWQMYGLNPGRHHLTNILFHIANTLLLFGLMRSLTGTFWRSAAGGGAFCPASGSCGIRGLGGGKEGRIKHVLWFPCHLGLCRLHAASCMVALSSEPGVVLVGPDVQTDAGHPALCVVVAGLMAA